MTKAGSSGRAETIQRGRRLTAGSRLAGICFLALLTATTSSSCGKKEAPPPPAPPAPPAAVEPPPAPRPPPPPAPAPPAAVGGVSLGTGIEADKKVKGAGETFGPKDTIYASIETTGVGSGTVLKAKWTFVGKKGKVVPVNEESQTVDLSGPATHEFHVSKKSPWPKGGYEVEVFLNDQSVAKKSFAIK